MWYLKWGSDFFAGDEEWVNTQVIYTEEEKKNKLRNFDDSNQNSDLIPFRFIKVR